MLNDEVASRYWLLCPYLRFLLPSCNGIALLCNVIIFTPPHPTNHRSHNKKKAWEKKQKCILTKVNKNDKFLHSIKKKSEKGRIFHIERFLRSSGIQRSKRPFVWVIGGNLVCFLFVSFCKGKKGQKFPINFYPKTLTNRLT